MKRSHFLRNSGLAAAGSLVLPSLLSCGKLFASTKNRKVKRVVICNLAAGVRNTEAFGQAEGALMPRIFGGEASPSAHVLALAGIDLASRNATKPLFMQGTFYKAMLCAQGPTSSEAATRALLSGEYQNDAYAINDTIAKQTMFDYFLANQGSSSSELTSIIDSKDTPTSLTLSSDQFALKKAGRILSDSKTSLMLVNLHDADIAHADFTGYCASLLRTDAAIADLWQHIQDTPSLKDETVLIVLSAHGRNAKHNGVLDAYGRFGLDHATLPAELGGDQSAREAFCLVLGPEGLVKKEQVIQGQSVESTNVLPFVGTLLGFETPGLTMQREIAFNSALEASFLI